MAKTGKTTSIVFGERLTRWYREAKRDLPWRKTRDAYAIWVSEVMLQQTQVATVVPYFERWMQRFPDVTSLARARDHDVLHAWQGLGYYSRARALLAGAREVVAKHAGKMPKNAAALRDLPGVGPYTAGAVASIAFDEREPIVDGNVARVLTRLFALRGDPARAPLKQELWQISERLIPETGAGDFNQALMELGATICMPRAPRCNLCPLRNECRAHAQGNELAYPELKKRVGITPVRMAAAVVERAGKVLVVRLPDDAPRWASMWQFPNAELAQGETPETAARRAVREIAGLDVTPRGLVTVVRHSVTRYRITLDVFRASAAAGRARPRQGHELRWKSRDELSELALPSAHARIARAL